MLVSTYTRADCDTSLGLCQKLVKDSENENLILKQKMGILVQQRDTAENALAKATEPKLIPDWAWFFIGASAGVVTYAIIRR